MAKGELIQAILQIPQYPCRWKAITAFVTPESELREDGRKLRLHGLKKVDITLP